MLRIPGIAVPQSVQLLSAITDPAAWQWMLAWWQEHRKMLRRYAPTIDVTLTAHREDLGIEPILPRPKMAPFRRKA